MQRFINNWITQLTAAAPADDSPLALPAEALARLDFAGGGEYLLTVVGSLNPLEQTVVERVLISAAGQQRGQDGTTEQAWPAAAYVFCDVSASVVESLLAAVADLQQRVAALESAPAAPQLVDGSGNTLTNNEGDALTPGGI